MYHWRPFYPSIHNKILIGKD